MFINGKEVAEKIAHLTRPGLVEKGIHKTGLCGFRFELPDKSTINLTRSSSIEIKTASINGDLVDIISNSPYEFNPPEWFIKLNSEFNSGKGQKILIVGIPKSGTSALTYSVAESVESRVYFEPKQFDGLRDVEFHKQICEQNARRQHRQNTVLQ